jgi:putative transcriptional regulator
MSRKAFNKIAKGLNEAIAIARGKADPSTYRVHVPSDVDVKAIRRKLGMSQDVFAKRFGFTPARVRDWEQGRSKPDGAIRAYLIVIDREREAVERALVAL